MDITFGLPATDNFQHWPPWRSLLVETARLVHADRTPSTDAFEGDAVMGLSRFRPWCQPDRGLGACA
jgi:hypothetical protein